jgi:hypothetical protein
LSFVESGCSDRYNFAYSRTGCFNLPTAIALQVITRTAQSAMLTISGAEFSLNALRWMPTQDFGS